MRLKRVRVFGFKTFADRTEFDIDADLIAIVGPNGCGKSNIVDAILWGLGEGNARNLRASKGEDVIFNGSAKRKPLGYAEVTLLFDNEDGSLPIDTAEVAISRRLTRAGDSNYSINKRTCRLKDVYDLLADSGLGRSGYAIVGQREIDSALSASADERRGWIDEAAGVQRFRAKRTESLRRLDEANEHLKRLEAMRADLDLQREPLKEEAEIAEIYIRTRDALAEIETGVLVEEFGRLSDEVGALENRIAEASAGAGRVANAEADLLQRRNEVGEVLADLERRIDAFRELRQAQLTAAERAENAVRMAEQKLDSLSELEKSVLGERTQTAQRMAELAAEVEEAEKDLAEARELLEALRAEVGSSESSFAALQNRLTELDGLIAAAGEAGRRRVALEAEQAQARSRLGNLNREIEGASSALGDFDEPLAVATAEAASSQAAFEAAKAEREAASNTIGGAKARLEAAEQALRKRRADHEVLDGRRRGIEATLEAHEGLGQGASAVMQLVRTGALPARYTPVAEALTTETEYAVAIETALGGAAHDLIVPSDGDAKAAIAILKERRLGRATFQPLNLVRPNHRSRELENAARRPGIVGIAADLIRFSEDHAPVMEALLGRVLVAETLDDALALSHQRITGWSRCVTLDGEVVQSGGAVSGGRSSRQTSGIVQRKAELAKIESELEEIKASILALADERARVEAAEAEAKASLAHLEEAVRSASDAFGQADLWLRKLRDERDSTARELQRFEREAESLHAVLAEALPEVMDPEPLQKERDETVAAVARTHADRASARQRTSETEGRLQRAGVRASEAKKRQEALESSTHRHASRLENLEEERTSLQRTIEDQREVKAECEARAAEAAAESQALGAQRESALQRNLELSAEERQLAEQSRALADAARTAEVERARAESRRTNTLQRLIEEYAISAEDALERRGQIEIPEDAPSVTARLKRELRGLGTPNLGAIEAFRRVDERWQELTYQLEDLLATREEVLAAVDELDKLTRDRFMDAFERVREEFVGMFLRLFEGGEAQLSLADPLNPLTSGVEIEVALPGKKRQRLELLSGGERSLCGCAFLFALLKVKPSPLVVLDEVDAPLDGRNVERYIDVLKSFRNITQFLVITHNPVTIEAATVWFGVTMREPGVTTVLPFQAPEEKKELVQAVVHEAFMEPQSALVEE